MEPYKSAQVFFFLILILLLKSKIDSNLNDDLQHVVVKPENFNVKKKNSSDVNEQIIVSSCYLF